MDRTVLFFLLGTITTTCIALFTVVLLRRPLSRLLRELCGGEPRSEFWVRSMAASMVLAATAASMFPTFTNHAQGETTRTLFLHTILQWLAGVGGLLASLIFISLVLVLHIRRFEARALVSRPAQPPLPVGSGGPEEGGSLP